MSINYQRLIEDSVARFSDLMRQHRRLDAEIARLEKEIVRRRKTLRWVAAHLRQNNLTPAATVPEISIAPTSFMDAVRRVLRSYPIWLTPARVRDLLDVVGFDIGRYRNPLADVHVTLRRLVARGEVIQDKTVSDQPAYLWNRAIVERNEASSTEIRFCSAKCDD